MQLAALSVLALITAAGKCWLQWPVKQGSSRGESARRCVWRGALNSLGSGTYAGVSRAHAGRALGRAACLLPPLVCSLFPDRLYCPLHTTHFSIGLWVSPTVNSLSFKGLVPGSACPHLDSFPLSTYHHSKVSRESLSLGCDCLRV